MTHPIIDRRRALVACGDGTARRASSSTASPATRGRCAASPKRSPTPASMSRCRCCPATAPSSTTCCRRVGPTGRARPRRRTSVLRSGQRTSWSVGLSMGGALTLRLGADHPEIAGLVCINPVTQAAGARGHRRCFAGWSTAAPPCCPASAATSPIPTPRRARTRARRSRRCCRCWSTASSRSATSTPTMRMPLLLMTSPQDHVVEPAQGDFLAEHYGGPRRAHHARAQLPRRHAGLRQGPDLRVDDRSSRRGSPHR